MLALRSRERELLPHCNCDELFCRQPNRCRPAHAEFLHVDQGKVICAKQIVGKLLEPSHCSYRRVSH